MQRIQTPWGMSDTIEVIAPGIFQVGTPSHGGVKLDRAHNARMPEYMRQPGGWYEEDCDWCLPFLIFQNEITEHGDEYAVKAIISGSAQRAMVNWHPDAYERYYGCRLLPGQSYARRNREAQDLENALSA